MYYMHSKPLRYTEDFDNGVQTYTFTGPCIQTGKTYSVKVLANELWELNQGKGIMALVSTSPDDREFLMNGFSPEGWDQLFTDMELDEHRGRDNPDLPPDLPDLRMPCKGGDA